MKRVFLATALALALAPAASAATAKAPDDGFAAFYKSFAAAAAKGDQTALAGLVILSPGLDDNDVPLTFAKFYRADLGPKARACLAKAKPMRQADPPSYVVTCGQVIFVFSKPAAVWRLTDLSADD